MVDVLAYNVFFIILCHFILCPAKAVHPFDSPMTFHIRHNSGVLTRIAHSFQCKVPSFSRYRRHTVRFCRVSLMHAACSTQGSQVHAEDIVIPSWKSY